MFVDSLVTPFSSIILKRPAFRSSNDFALMSLLSQWSGVGNRSSMAAITHDGADDDFYGSTGDDDFCWENLDVLEDFPAPAGADFNATGMGTDERFGPLM